ncbi:MAG: tetratricopeptide repeat protein [Flavobacteriales bacterium]|nr:tetratricopeptide repeat protein [Flavobacteriales bacterium]
MRTVICIISRIILTLLIFTSLSIQSQNKAFVIDSLEARIQSGLSDSNRVILLRKIANETASSDRIRNKDTHQLIIELCETKLLSELTVNQSFFYKRQLASSYNSLGVNYFLNANFNSSTDLLLKSIQLSKEIEAFGMLAKSYTVLGVIQKNLKDYATSSNSLKLAVNYADSAKDNNSKALAYNNLGLNQLLVDSIASAIVYFEKTKELYQLENNQRGLGVVFVNLGSCNKKRAMFEDAIELFKQSIEIRNEINDKQGLIFSHHRLGETYFELEKLSLAESHGKISLELAIEKGYPRGLRDANHLLYRTNKRRRNLEKALYYYEKYIVARDSLINKENIREVTKLESQYLYEQVAIKDSLRNEEKVKSVEKDLAIEKANTEKQSVITISLSFFLLLIGIAAYYIYDRYKKEKAQKLVIEAQKLIVDKSLIELAKRDEEKEILLKEIHHRVKNNLQVISSLLDLQTDKIEDKSALIAMEDGQSRVKAMALIHQNLYQNQDISSVSFKEYANQLINQLASVYSPEHTVKVELKSDEVFFDIDTAIPLGLILNELISNAYKYAFKSNVKEKLTVSLTNISVGEYCLEVGDNGDGLAPDFELKKAKSLGLRLVHRLSRQLYGKVDYLYDQGAKFEIIFKDTQQRKLVQ